MAAGRRVAPDGGVVDAGEVRGEVDLLAWACSWGSSPCSSGGGVAVGGAGQAEQPAQGARLVGGAEQAAALQLGHQPAGDRRSGRAAARRAAAGSRSARPRCHSASRSARPAGVPVNTVASLRYSAPASVVEPRLAGPGRRGSSSSRKTTRSPKHVHRLLLAPGRRLRAADLGDDLRGVRRRPAGSRSRRRPSGRPARYGTAWWASAATIGCPCGGRGVIDGPRTREVAALEVDVVQLRRGRRTGRWRRPGSRRRPPSCPRAGAAPRRSRPPRRRRPRSAAPRRGSAGDERREAAPAEQPRPRARAARPGPGRRPGRCSRSPGWRSPWTGGTARCG